MESMTHKKIVILPENVDQDSWFSLTKISQGISAYWEQAKKQGHDVEFHYLMKENNIAKSISILSSADVIVVYRLNPVFAKVLDTMRNKLSVDFSLIIYMEESPSIGLLNFKLMNADNFLLSRDLLAHHNTSDPLLTAHLFGRWLAPQWQLLWLRRFEII